MSSGEVVPIRYPRIRKGAVAIVPNTFPPTIREVFAIVPLVERDGASLGFRIKLKWLASRLEFHWPQATHGLGVCVLHIKYILNWEMAKSQGCKIRLILTSNNYHQMANQSRPDPLESIYWSRIEFSRWCWWSSTARLGNVDSVRVIVFLSVWETCRTPFHPKRQNTQTVTSKGNQSVDASMKCANTSAGCFDRWTTMIQVEFWKQSIKLYESMPRFIRNRKHDQSMPVCRSVNTSQELRGNIEWYFRVMLSEMSKSNNAL